MKTVNAKRLDEVRALLGQVFDEKWSRSELENFDELREKFVFHMTDAIDDVLQLADIYRADSPLETQPAAENIYGFFLHALPHLLAAGQIYDYVPQTFDEQKGVHSSD